MSSPVQDLKSDQDLARWQGCKSVTRNRVRRKYDPLREGKRLLMSGSSDAADSGARSEQAGRPGTDLGGPDAPYRGV